MKYITGDLVKYSNRLSVIQAINMFAFEEVETGNYKIIFNEPIEDCVKPIPLTPKILEKNGWEKETTHLFLKNVVCAYTLPDVEGFGYCPILLAEDYNENFVVYPFTDGHVCKPIAYIKYISDLQHLLFGLGLDSRLEV